MISSTLLYIATFGSGIASVIAGDSSGLPSRRELNDVCREIACSISNASEVYDMSSENYAADISHWASSSTQSAMCSFEPGTAEDVGIALHVLGRSKTPFAVKGGGHTANPGFSSTTGVQIAMSRFSQVSYNSTAQTVTIGAGLIWDDVYAALEPYGMNVVGGRVTGVGVAGFTLSGGYSWLTNQYGLTIDTVQAFETVLPNGTVIDVTETSSPDLFFALKGGLNNFGVVTRFTLKAFPQSEVWGGLITYSAEVLDQVNLAVANFGGNNNDPKAEIITTYNTLLGVPGAFLLIFYDGPSPPDGVFDEFLAITSVQDVSTRSFLSLVQTAPANLTYGTRGIFNTISLGSYSLDLLDSIVNETIYWGEKLALETGYFITYDVEPLMSSIFSHSTALSAWPPSRAQGFHSLHLYYAWVSPAVDEIFQDAIRTSASTLKAQVTKSGDDVADAALYPNYAIFDTPVAELYGDNLPRLQAIKAMVDPDNVMGLAGGFKI